jgi:hypothetical protein
MQNPSVCAPQRLGFWHFVCISVFSNLISMDCFIDSRGYLRFRDSRKLVHRWMAEKKMGRKLYDHEVVHHINRNKLDNRFENLFVCENQSHHFMLHIIDARKFGWKISLHGFQPGNPVAA